MQITSVRYRKLVSLRGCEHKALEAESPPSGPASRGNACCSLSLLPFVSLKES